MRYVKMIFLSTIIVFSSISLSGCLVAAVGAGIAAVKYGNAKKQEAMAKESRSYNEYVLGMEKINMEREAKKLPPQPILSISQYNVLINGK